MGLSKCFWLGYLVLLSSVPVLETAHQLSRRRQSILVVDPFIDFLHAVLLEECDRRNIRLYDAVSGYTDAILTAAGDNFHRNIVPADLNRDEIRTWAKIFDPDESISCVISESDVGVSSAERVQVALGLRGNGFSPHLRSKYEVNEACKAAGLLTTSQILTSDWENASHFIDNLPCTGDEGPLCIVKPCRGVASDGVYLCKSKADARKKFNKLKGTENCRYIHI